MFNTLRFRLLASYFLVAFICLSVTSCLLLALVGPLQNQLIYSRLLDRAVPTALWVRELSNRNVPPSEIVRRAQGQMDRLQSRMFLVNREGMVLADTDGQMTGQTVGRFETRETTSLQWPVRDQWRSPTGQRYYYISLPAAGLRAMRQALPDDTVFVVLATQHKSRVIFEVLPFLLIAALVGFFVSVLLAWLISRWISWPLQKVAGAAEEIALGNYDQSLEISSPDEVRSLANSFNHMTQQVKAAQNSQRDFVANVSHELKTPLTSVQGFAQAILDGTARDTSGQQHAAQIIRNEAQRMARLVEDLLELAKISGDRDRSIWTELDVSTLMEACVQRLSVLAEENQVNFRLDTLRVPYVRGNPDRLAQVFTNLLDNALKHSPTGGEIVVATRVSAEPSPRRGKKWIEISVGDSGPGIPPEDLTRIFERFYQVDKSRAGQKSGAGLGLAIVHEIIEAHEGQIRVENRQGSGALFTVILPEV